MKTLAVPHHHFVKPARRSSIGLSTLRFILDHFLLLPFGSLMAIVWANTWPESYFVFARRSAFAVNDVGMALFLGFVGQLIWEELMPGGALHTWRRWMLPVAAALGGIWGSTLTYLMYVTASYEEVLRPGWPAATAVDVAFVFFIARLIFRRHPAVSFLLLIAIVSNMIGFLAIAPRFHLADVRPGGPALLLAGVGLASALRLRGVSSFVPYLLGAGPLLWGGFYLQGLHPALALIPLVPFLPHQPRGGDMFKDHPHGPADSPSRAEHIWKHPAQAVLFLFGLVNAGILMTSYGTGTWALLTASLVGRPLGILTGIALGVAFGLHPPAWLNRRERMILAFAGSTGFTMALFFAASAYPFGPILSELKLGALATGAGLLVTLGLAVVLHVGRFAGRATHEPHHGAARAVL
jgi:Na+:H+ antiporter, NhaA family